jgi:hypothetical protein
MQIKSSPDNKVWRAAAVNTNFPTACLSEIRCQTLKGISKSINKIIFFDSGFCL